MRKKILAERDSWQWVSFPLLYSLSPLGSDYENHGQNDDNSHSPGPSRDWLGLVQRGNWGGCRDPLAL